MKQGERLIMILYIHGQKSLIEFRTFQTVELILSVLVLLVRLQGDVLLAGERLDCRLIGLVGLLALCPPS